MTIREYSDFHITLYFLLKVGFGLRGLGLGIQVLESSLWGLGLYPKP